MEKDKKLSVGLTPSNFPGCVTNITETEYHNPTPNAETLLKLPSWRANILVNKRAFGGFNIEIEVM